MNVDALDIQMVVKELLILREREKIMKKMREEEDAPFHARKAELDAEIMRRCAIEGRNNQRTNYGTAYLTDRVSVVMDDPDTFRSWVKESGQWTLAEIRASKTGVEDYVSEHHETPPGLRREVTVTVAVRKD